MEREALKLALDALESKYIVNCGAWRVQQDQAITAIKEALTQPAQEPTEAWPCVIETADFEEDTVTLAMQCTDYKVSAGKHWLSTIPPQRKLVLQREWVDLTNEEIDKWAHELHGVIYAVMADLKEKNK